ncbi:protein of unknown function DUF1214 [Nitrobacter hamburgensis X14]|uniref:DUF1254 domain-containing protein n=1 Tax=Nitrobacter hamburgensis (strain DSM 10229 / NCIMB 13809 / X14) TaxID=323097 RepID=Q1QJ57_NITHX|nr:DUF1254 domain-containing protein [Nitrobacter hamburgensis]ABE63740.1 protein of unknown function DUF1214 [Nitrobacter hamburgensis X14]
MKKKLLVAFALCCLSSAAVAQAPSADDSLVRSRAVEAVIWGMPAANYDLMLQPALKSGAKENEIIYWSRPVDWHNQTLTPNPDALYFMIFFNTKEAGPIVIDVPPADDGSFAANIDTVWQMPLEDAGPYGADKGAGGKYLILPPGYNDTPPDGYIVVRSETFAGYALFRSNLASHSEADIAKAAKYGKRLKVYPLSQAAAPPETKFTDAKVILYDSTIPYDLRFFRSLDRIVQTEPWQTRDKAMIDQLKSIGIEKGKAFNPDARATTILNGAAADARGVLDRMYDAGFPPFFASSRWAVPAFPALVKAGSSGYAETDMYPVDARALTYSIGYIGIKRLGTAQTYLIAGKDRDGKALGGNKTYRLHVPPNVPVNLYWSVTAYDRQTHALIKNMPRASRASNAAEVQKNADGSVDIYFGPKPPPGKDANWVPTDPQRDFELLFRIYGPKKEFFDRIWVLPDVEKIAAQ